MTSHWRAEARQAIEAALAATPKDASFADKKRAIDTAYPFGPLLSPLDRARAAYLAANPDAS